MSGKRLALIIASSQFEDKDLSQLIAPARDAEELARVLGDPEIGNFEVETLINRSRDEVGKAIEAFFQDRKRNDLLLLYYSGHGIKDENGQLYFAVPNTQRNLLRSTAIPSRLLHDVMEDSRSRRQVLILDCCYSGAFTKALRSRDDRQIGTKERFEGHGRVILTASDNMQYAFEGDKLEGEGIESIFTNNLIKGLETGEADLNNDGEIDLDELYDYVFDQVREKTSKMTPRKWSDVQGEIIIASTPNFLPKYNISRIEQANNHFGAGDFTATMLITQHILDNEPTNQEAQQLFNTSLEKEYLKREYSKFKKLIEEESYAEATEIKEKILKINPDFVDSEGVFKVLPNKEKTSIEEVFKYPESKVASNKEKTSNTSDNELTNQEAQQLFNTSLEKEYLKREYSKFKKLIEEESYAEATEIKEKILKINPDFVDSEGVFKVLSAEEKTNSTSDNKTNESYLLSPLENIREKVQELIALLQSEGRQIVRLGKASYLLEIFRIFAKVNFIFELMNNNGNWEIISRSKNSNNITKPPIEVIKGLNSEVYTNNKQPLGFMFRTTQENYFIVPLINNNWLLINTDKNYIWTEVYTIMIQSYFVEGMSLEIFDIEKLEEKIYDALKRVYAYVPKEINERRLDLFLRNFIRVGLGYLPIISLMHKEVAIVGWEVLFMHNTNNINQNEIFSVAELWGREFLMEADIAKLGLIADSIEAKNLFNGMKRNLYNAHFPIHTDSLFRKNYIEMLREFINEKSFSPKNVVLEISAKHYDTADYLNNDANYRKEFNENIKTAINKLGVQLGINDFEVGYSSSSIISKLNPQFVKINRSILATKNSGLALEYIINVIQRENIKSKIIVDGFDIESDLSLSDIIKLGIRYIQGNKIRKIESSVRGLTHDEINAITKMLES